jgi:Arc/MetJ-type ribon-helix-helix transcriptional regulator
MTINLRPEHERLVAPAIESGMYQSPDEVIGRALEILSLEDAWFRDNVGLIHDKIERAFEQFDRGEFYSAEESRSDMEKRKTEWLASKQRR